jgi:GTP-binding protein Era
MTEESKKFKAGYVAIVGVPNVGKSTLMNALLQQKLSIVAKKPQTTRQRVLGILNQDDAQVIFLDTPGILKPKYLLHEKMVGHAESALSEADLILAITEISRKHEIDAEVEKSLKKYRDKPVLLVINKVDLVSRAEVLPVIEALAKNQMFKEIIPISALKRENLDDLLKTVLNYLPEHPPFYPKDALSEQPERFFVAEFIREKIFEQYKEEIPYSTAVEIVVFKEREEGKSYVQADIIVERESQKGILIGEKGRALKRVGQLARKDIEEFLGYPIFLELRVKVKEGWREKEVLLRRLGYTVEKE